jgi:Flp pilus assembly pilin Flp
MRYRLRTLLFMLAVGPPMLAGLWWYCARLVANEMGAGAVGVLVFVALVSLAAVVVLVSVAKALEVIGGAK